jgi:uncharacterized protein
LFSVKSNFMENIIFKSKQKANQVKSLSRRYLYNQIDWSNRIIVLSGFRGSGKTTLLLQRMSEVQKGIYLNLDDLFFESNRIVDIVAKLYAQGFRNYFLDEVHRYPHWSQDLKQLYDDYMDIQIVATSSSILDLSKGKADLSRRAIYYTLNGLSFREYLLFSKKLELSPFSLSEIIARHHEIAPDLTDLFDYKKEFGNYLNHGYYPFFLENESTYSLKLRETINLVIDLDIAQFEQLNYETIRILKKLLYIISQSVPFSPNISSLATKLATTRNTILRLLDLLDQGHMLGLLKRDTKGSSFLQKPEKIYLQNPNLIYSLSEGAPNTGNIRETFFMNQVSVKHQVSAPKFGDFLVDDTYLFEVGGPSKTNEQIQGLPKSYLAIDTKVTNGKAVPLWLFGMLY